MRLGAPFAAEVFAEETDDPVALAKGHRAKGYGAAFCPEISLKDPGTSAPSRQPSLRRMF